MKSPRNPANPQPDDHLMSMRKPHESVLLGIEIFTPHVGSEEYCVVIELGIAEYEEAQASRLPDFWQFVVRPLLVRHINRFQASDPVIREAFIRGDRFEQLLEPLKHIQVSPYPGESPFLVRDGVTVHFEVVMGSTCLKSKWYDSPAEGWEPIEEWLWNTKNELDEILAQPSSKPPKDRSGRKGLVPITIEQLKQTLGEPVGSPKLTAILDELGINEFNKQAWFSKIIDSAYLVFDEKGLELNFQLVENLTGRFARPDLPKGTWVFGSFTLSKKGLAMFTGDIEPGINCDSSLAQVRSKWGREEWSKPELHRYRWTLRDVVALTVFPDGGRMDWLQLALPTD